MSPVRVKICGLTRAEHALAAAGAGADMIGFVFHPPSPRFRPPDTFRDIADALVARYGAAAPERVGVFVKTPLDTMQAFSLKCDLTAVQPHGLEDNDDIRRLRDAGLRVYLPVAIGDEASLEVFDRFEPDAFLCDTPDPDLWGGTGRAFDHRLVQGLSEHARLILAGGLTPDNVADAVRGTRPWAVDVSSGVEQEPGEKDPDKVRAFIEAARGAAGT